MTPRLLLISALAVMLAHTVYAQDEKLLQGTWNVLFFGSTNLQPTDEELNAMKVVIGNGIFNFQGKKTETNAFRLDSSTKPKSMHLLDDSGKEVAVFSYDLDGDHLKMAWRKPGAPPPTEFMSKDNEGLMILWRAGAKKVPDAAVSAAEAKEMSLLKGTWQLLSMEMGGEKPPPPDEIKTMKLIIEDGTLVMDNGKRLETITFTLDPSTTPKAMDMAKKDEKEKGLAIYEVAGDSLKLCFGKPGTARPTGFAVKPDAALLVLERIKPPAGASAEQDLKLLQGTWNVVSAEDRGNKPTADEIKTMKLVITGESATLSMGEHTESGTLHLDVSSVPKHLDMSINGGQADAALFIYELQGDHLKLCWRKPGSPRPTEFTAKDTDGLMVLERAK